MNHGVIWAIIFAIACTLAISMWHASVNRTVVQHTPFISSRPPAATEVSGTPLTIGASADDETLPKKKITYLDIRGGNAGYTTPNPLHNLGGWLWLPLL